MSKHETITNFPLEIVDVSLEAGTTDGAIPKWAIAILGVSALATFAWSFWIFYLLF
jgi:hypothetical protein